MYFNKLMAVFILLLLLLGPIPAMEVSSGEDIEKNTRDDQNILNIRSDSAFFPGEVRNQLYADVTGNGVDEAIIVSRQYPPGQYYLHVIDLDTGDVLFSHVAQYGNLNVQLLNVDDDPEMEIVVDDYDHHIQHTHLFIYDPGTDSVIFEPPIIDGRYQLDILEDELVLQVMDDPTSYTPDRIVWWETYSLPSLTLSWTSPKFVRPTGVNIDIDNDGIKEYIVSSNWMDYSPYRGNIYFIDIADHEVRMNTTDVGYVGYLGSTNTQFKYHDLDDDGYIELLVHAYWPDNGTSRTYLYSSRTNSLVWSGPDMGDMRLRDAKYDDITGDGKKEIMLILSARSTEYESRFVAMNSETGEVLVDEFVNNRFFSGHIFPMDLDGDGGKELLIYNETSHINGDLTFRLYDPSDSWNMDYNITLDDIKETYIGTYLIEDELTILAIGEGSLPGTESVNVRRYDPATMDLMFSMGDFDIGSGSYKWNTIYFGENRTMNQIIVKYISSTEQDYSQLHIIDHWNGSILYSSDMFEFDHDVDLRTTPYPLNNDSRIDFILQIKTKETPSADWMGNIHFLNGETFEIFWSSPQIDGLNSYSMDSYSFAEWPGMHGFHISRGGTEQGYNNSMWNLSGEEPVMVFALDYPYYHYMEHIDLGLDGTPELEIRRMVSSSITEIDYYRLSGDGYGATLIDTLIVNGGYANSVPIDANGDGNSIIYVYSNNNFYYFSYPELELITSIETQGYSYNHLTYDLDQDLVDEMIWGNPVQTGDTGTCNFTIIDLNSGLPVWELRDQNYSASFRVMDIDNDRYHELLFIKKLYWSDVKMWGISVYNVTTDLRPEPIEPLPIIQLVEDGPGETLHLQDLFWNDGPMTFDARDLSGSLDVSLDTDTNILTVTPLPDEYGMKKVEIMVSDDLWEVPFILYVNISPVNDGIDLIGIDGLLPVNGTVEMSLYHETEYYLNISVEDPDDDFESFEMEKDVFGISFNASSMQMYVNLPLQAGTNVSFNFTGMDSNGSIFQSAVFIDILNIPHAPFDPLITSFEEGATFRGWVSLAGTAKDPDMPWGDELSFDWSSDIDGHIATDPQEGEKYILTPGNHKVTMTAIDTYGLSANTSKNITVEEIIEPHWFDMITEETTDTGNFEVEISQANLLVSVLGTEGDYRVEMDFLVEGTCADDVEILFFYLWLSNGSMGSNMVPFHSGNANSTTVHENGFWSFDYSIEESWVEIRNVSGSIGVVAWSQGRYVVKTMELEVDQMVTIPDDDEDDDEDDNDTDDDDSTDDDNTQKDPKGASFLRICLITIAAILLIVIMAFLIIAYRISKKRKGMEWEE